MARGALFKQYEFALLYRLHQVYGYSFDATARFLGRSRDTCVKHFIIRFALHQEYKKSDRIRNLYKSQRLEKNKNNYIYMQCSRCRKWFWSPSRYIRRCRKCKNEEKKSPEFYGYIDTYNLIV